MQALIYYEVIESECIIIIQDLQVVRLNVKSVALHSVSIVIMCKTVCFTMLFLFFFVVLRP